MTFKIGAVGDDILYSLALNGMGGMIVSLVDVLLKMHK